MYNYCPKCGNRLMQDNSQCQSCGFTPGEMPSTESNEIPYGVSRWNMGAFMQTFLWGISNDVYESLAIFVVIIPFVGWIAGVFIAIWLGLKGNEMAWKKKKWDSVRDFNMAQSSWNKAGWVTFIVLILSSVIYFLLFVVIGIFSASEIFNTGVPI